MRRIKLTAGSVELIAELRDTPTAEAIHSSLPVRSEARSLSDLGRDIVHHGPDFQKKYAGGV